MARKTMTKLEEYKEQNAANQKAAEVFHRKIAQADEEYQALKAKHEAVIRESVISGVDKTAELDELAAQIEAAKVACERRREEQQVYSTMNPLSTITRQDVLAAFNNEVVPAFKSDRFDAVLERLVETKKTYADAVLDYHAALSEFEDLREDHRAEVAPTMYHQFYYQFTSVEPDQKAEHERLFFTKPCRTAIDAQEIKEAR